MDCVGIYFQKHHKRTLGSPDICIPSKKIAIFIDGDFWHGYRYKTWKDRLGSDFWRQKIERNMARDKRTFRKLRKEGWTVMRVWEHALQKDTKKTISNIEDLIKDIPLLKK